MKKIFAFSLLALLCFCAVAQSVTLTGHDVQLSQNTPNPFNGTTDVYLTTTEAGTVTMEIADINGRMVVGTNNYSPQLGVHQFRITLATPGTYVLTARQNGQTSSIKMICNGGGNGNSIEYVGGIVKTTHALSPQTSQENSHITTSGTGSNGTVYYAQMEESEENDEAVEKKKPVVAENNEPFRVALSLSPFSLNQFEQGYSFNVNGRTASTPEELQQIYRDLGSTEMYVRIATKRHVTAENTVDGVEDENANVHTFDQAIRLCQIAAELDIPINPEIMCAYTYMDMMNSQGPRFQEYPEIYALQQGKDWSELTLDEICTVLEAYGAFVAESILNTGCTVNNWNLGNEANFCFAGIGIGAKTAVNPKLAKASNLKRYLAPAFSIWWLKKHVWQYDAPAYAAVKRGVLSAYAKLGISDSLVKFSTHVATVVFPAKCSVKFFNYMKDNGYEMDVAGISYYPSAPSMSNRKKLLKKTVAKINQKCDLPVFIGEFSYPSGKMDGPFAGWNKKLKGYKKDQQGQANLYADVIAWGKENGMAGIRYWAPDYEGWYAMAMFEFSNKVGTAKTILQNHKELLEK
ncbi:MAG: glycosyl hydrolase 53 family protein [Bacteroidales bacterium]|nr:glycosyl hydrolase 53 family protein [Bacteroidales bacterium]